ncbi:hypothetical protein EVAR_13962_1 [Eumeta japonica]|uniref:Uncharacterized protein n=1 Tax=Eumeta variegata TaxID=151549 RepID=A0A4C1U8K6_EUMVA|nr:hypothetical protein EVAR_13962_1 [Eumeta japonica]
MDRRGGRVHAARSATCQSCQRSSYGDFITTIGHTGAHRTAQKTLQGPVSRGGGGGGEGGRRLGRLAPRRKWARGLRAPIDPRPPHVAAPPAQHHAQTKPPAVTDRGALTRLARRDPLTDTDPRPYSTSPCTIYRQNVRLTRDKAMRRRGGEDARPRSAARGLPAAPRRAPARGPRRTRGGSLRHAHSGYG